MRDTPGRTSEVDWATRWKSLVAERSAAAGAHGDTAYWDRRAPSFARSTRARADEFLDVVTPYLSPRKTLIDVGAGAGRHALPLADRLEWVTAIEPSEGMRALIPPRDNMTVVRSEEHTSELQSRLHLVCRLLLEKKKITKTCRW